VTDGVSEVDTPSDKGKQSICDGVSGVTDRGRKSGQKKTSVFGSKGPKRPNVVPLPGADDDEKELAS
jgi:hypothetical protein